MNNVTSTRCSSVAETLTIEQCSLASVRRAATLNLEGANWFSNGDMQKAYGSFKSALEVLSHAELTLLLQLPGYAFASVPLPSTQCPTPRIEHCPPFLPQQQQQYGKSLASSNLQKYATMTRQTDEILRVNPFRMNESKKPSHESSKGTRTSNSRLRVESTFFVYNEPFLFRPPASPVNRQGMGLFKAQILFNLAIVLHQGGQAVNENAVFQALRVYDLCLECTISLLDSQELDSLVVTIAALNNKAQIFHEFCETNSLLVVLDTLQMAMVFLPKGVEFMDGLSLQGILFNVHILRDLQCARAA